MTDTSNARDTVRHQPETLRLRTLTPALTVADLDVSLTWYCDVMGFVVVEKWEDEGKISGVIVEAGRVRLFLVQDDFAKGQGRDKGAGFRFFCATAQDVDQLADAIKSRGGGLEQDPADQPWGSRSFDLVDPDGFKLTVTSLEPSE